MKVLGLLLLALLSLSVSGTILGNNKLPKGVTEILSVNATFPKDNDLTKFDTLARRAEIFAIGESAHGVSGYQNFHFRLSKYLITKFGYRRVLSEMVSDDRALNQYITTGQGDLKMILYNNPWQNSDIETYNFYQWIRLFNVRNPRDMVTVHSVDPQAPWLDIPFIKTFLAGYDTEYNQTFSNTLYPTIQNNCFGAKYNNQIEWAFSPDSDEYYFYQGLPSENTTACISSVSYLEDLIKAEYSSLKQLFGYTFVEDVVYALRSIRSWQTKSATLFNNDKQSARFREVVFGLNVLWKAKRDNNRKKGSILLAHNLHISKDTLLEPFYNTGDVDFFNKLHSVGYIIRENIGERKYVTVAQSGYSVFPMFGLPYPVPFSPLSIDVTLNALNRTYLLLDTSASWVKAQGTWLVHEEQMPNGRYYPLSSAFDRLVFHSVAPKSIFVNPTIPSSSSSSSQKSLSSRMENLYQNL